MTLLVAARWLLAAPLDVALHELLGVLLEDVVDLVQEVVEVLLDLLALLGELRVRSGRVVAPVGLGGSRLLLLLLSHERSPPGPRIGAGAGAWIVGRTIPCCPWYFPCRSA